jgi:polysaccharide export outer membrane protein
MSRKEIMPQLANFGLIAVLTIVVGMLISTRVDAQQPSSSRGQGAAQRNGAKTGQSATVTGTSTSPDLKDEYDQMSRDMIRKFSENYRVGPQDSIAIRVKGQPDYSVEKAKVSPTGTIYHPLLGDVAVAGMTLEQVKKQLTTDLSEYVLDPVVSIELLEAQSAKVGVIGEVKAPRVLVMTGPLTVLDAIAEAGGFTDLGKKSNVTLLRHNQTLKINVDNILKGRARPEDNIALQPGDTVIVHGNGLKTLSVIASITSFASLLSLIQLGSR